MADGSRAVADRPPPGRRVTRALLSLLGVGFLPGPTGTWASAITVAGLLAATGPGAGPFEPAVLAALLAGSVVTLLFAGAEAGPDGHGDPGFVVSDEVAGQALALALAGASARGDGFVAAGLAFLLFRALDITKPGPVGAAERWPGGLGVLADDLVAGAGAGAVVLGLRMAGVLG